MKKNIIKTIVFIPKLMFFFLLFSAILFTSCTRDKVIEKIIYGEPITNGDNGNNGNIGNNGNNNSSRLSREQFNAITITREFNDINDFYNYIKKCYTNKTDLRGIKFKIRGTFNITSDFVQYYSGDGHYCYKRYSITTDYSNKPYMSFIVDFIDTDLNSTISNIADITFIVNYLYYYYDNQSININGYSYL